jgi:hypothetical protein
MKKLIVLAMVGMTAASCTQTERGAGVGAASGAVIGGLVTGNVRGAAAGAIIGGATGAVLGSVAEQPGQCYYRDGRGREYIDYCPANARVVYRPYRPVYRARTKVVVRY